MMLVQRVVVACMIGLALAHDGWAGQTLAMSYGDVRYRGRPVAYFTDDGRCAIFDGEREKWVVFSSGAKSSVAGAFPASLAVNAETPDWRTNKNRLAVVIRVHVDGWRPAAQDLADVNEMQQSGAKAIDWSVAYMSRIGRGEDVPLFLAEFVSRTCWIESRAHADALERVRTLPRRARKWVVDLISVAARLRYQYPEDLFQLGHERPTLYIPLYAHRCGAARDCDVWVRAVRRGFFNTRPPNVMSGESQ